MPSLDEVEAVPFVVGEGHRPAPVRLPEAS